MSANVKSSIAGVLLPAVGLILLFAGKGFEIPVFTLGKLGLVLAILGGVELVVTAGVLAFPSKRADRR
ncbi:DUF5708 family protein [Amycolatopsis sp. H20-H5]|uniref:DUF5708 family protein n=1 Tax=Amycolatopsis sp. H20-H5 TaxID=3046309 RepID=UPI002DBFAF6D|nr:DUF5708 family protein [Amycolatopsis sp. H20-H5]MEC3973859.1 DUF5708 family protein [Amycolatopsis sp. H20-H5]